METKNIVFTSVLKHGRPSFRFLITRELSDTEAKLVFFIVYKAVQLTAN